MPECNGEGRCLKMMPSGAYKRRHCVHMCTPIPCDKCGFMFPIWMIELWSGRCSICEKIKYPEFT